MNSVEYWNKRFEGNWEMFQGSEQTQFFVNLMCKLLPDWFIRDIRLNSYKICDMGCALGEGVDILSKYFGYNIEGCDFSYEAISKAKKYYPQYDFNHMDLLNLQNDTKYDIIITSNVLEHFYNPWDVISNLCKITSKYIIIMVPFEETIEVTEHVYNFTLDLIKINIEDFSLIYCNSIDASKIEATFYDSPQIVLIYSKSYEDRKVLNLKDISGNLDYKKISNIENLNRQVQKLTTEKMEIEDKYKELSVVNENLCVNEINIKAEYKYLNEKFEECKLLNESLYEEKNKIEHQLILKNEELELSQKNLLYKDSKINDFPRILKEQKKFINLKNKQINEMNIKSLKEIYEKDSLFDKNLIYDLQIECQNIKSSFFWRMTKPFRIISNFIGISKFHQFVKNYRILKRVNGINFGEFIYYNIKQSKFLPLIKKIVPSKIRYSMSSKYYSPSVFEILNPNKEILVSLSCFLDKIKPSEQLILVFSGVKYVDNEGQRNIRLVHEAIKKGIKIIYAYWRWDISEPIEKSNNDMLQIPIDVLYNNRIDIFENYFKNNIKNKLMLVEFPHPYAAEIVDIGNCFGWITSYDVIDDWDEFSKVGQAVWYDKKVELRIANSVDVNIATATRLKEKISKEILNNSNYYIVNNGVDPSKMKQSARLPDYDNSKGILQIGYFGHLTDSWFDWELLRYLAEKHLDWTFHIIGYGEPDNLKIPENIILYGKKEPLELPKYAAFWDVAIIPFIDSELTLSVNPIKIYEYLQLRLPTVTTNMPEVKRFPYTEITTDRESFEKAILDSKKIIIDDKVIDDFIKDNTWEKRIESILEHIKNFNESDTYKAIFFGGDK